MPKILDEQNINILNKDRCKLDILDHNNNKNPNPQE